MTELQHDLWLISPAICLAGFAIVIQVLGLNKSLEKKTAWMGLIAIVFAIFLLLVPTYHASIDSPSAFNNSIFFTEFTTNYILLVLIFASLAILAYKGYVIALGQPIKAEYIVFILLSLSGSVVAILSSSLIVLFISLELQALIGYMLACFDRDNPKSSEAGLKYFILGALASCLILLGMSFIYGFSGSIMFHEIIEHEVNIGIVAGTALLFCGFMFKMSAAPFHMWTPDVYEGAPISSVVFFASVQKISTVSVLISIFYIIASSLESNLIVKVFAITSMLVGSIGGIMQKSVKRLMAYSTILNLGFVLIPFANDNNMGSLPLIYLTIYAVGTLGLLTLLIIALGSKADNALLSDLSGFAQNNKLYANLICILVFSLIGLPPLAGFFGKYYIILNAVQNNEYMLAMCGVLASVIAAFYYLKIIRFVYFEKPSGDQKIYSNFYLSLIAYGSVIFTVMFMLTGQ